MIFIDCWNIDNIYIQIEELKKQIAEMKNKVIVPLQKELNNS